MLTTTIKYGVITFSSINLMPVETPEFCDVPYCCSPYHPGTKAGILTRDSALLLLKLHPLILWSPKFYCVLGRRVLHLVSPHLFGKDVITVGFLSDATEGEVRQLMAAESLLNQIAFATVPRGKGIFTTSRKAGPEIVNSVAPLLTKSIETVAKLLPDCSVSTLNKLSGKLDHEV